MPFVSLNTSTPWHAGVINVPATRGPMRPQSFEVYARQRLASDSLGTTVLRLTNVVVGSRYRIEIASTGVPAEPSANAGGVAAASTVDITLNYYAAGNSNNDVRIKVRSASGSTKYKPYETQATLTKAAQSVFIAQVPD